MSAVGLRQWGKVPAQASAAAAGGGASCDPPFVAILCAQSRARVAAAGVALALARVTGRRSALVGAVGMQAGTASLPATPAARAAASALQRRRLQASATGRLVWLADRRGPLEADEAPSRCAALSAELGRAAAALGLPAAVALPCVRTDALDRMLAWHDAIVVVREPDAPDALVEQALASLAWLGRPAVALAPPSRVAGALALAGLVAPAEATAAALALSQTGRGRCSGPDA